jgi:hypothetical protein
VKEASANVATQENSNDMQKHGNVQNVNGKQQKSEQTNA